MAETTQPEEVPWNLFKQIALGDEVKDNHNVLNIAIEIYSQYQCVPSLLKNIAVLLSYKHSIKEWEFFYDNVLKSMQNPSEIKLPHPDFSAYEKLLPIHKQCLRFCSLFPKDYQLTKTELLHLWASEDEGLVDDECFQELQEKGYFSLREGTEDVIEMQVLVNAFVEEIGKPEFVLVDETNPREIDSSKVLHISVRVDSTWEVVPEWVISNAINLQSLLFLPRKPHDYATKPKINEILITMKYLRALDLVGVNCENLGNSIGELKHLTYLRLGISFEKLPESITRLVNLHTLDLRQSGVIVLPKDFHNLTKLRNLYTGGRLIDMPPNFGKLKCLQNLDEFVVGKNNGLDALAELKHLVGKLIIRYQTKPTTRQGMLEVGKNITHLSLTWSSFYYEKTIAQKDKDHCLKLPTCLEYLSVDDWKGESFPHSLTDQIHLVSLCIENCSCTNLPDLKELPQLKSLQLRNLNALEYIESNDDEESNYDQRLSAQYSVALEYVMLADLPELRGWSSNLEYLMSGLTPNALAGVKYLGWSPRKYGLFHCVHLKLNGCPKMKWKLELPKLVSLEAHNISKELLHEILAKTRSLSKLEIVSVMELGRLDLEDQLNLQDLTFRRCRSWKTLDAEKTLNSLQISDCPDLEYKISAYPVTYFHNMVIKNCPQVGLRLHLLKSLKLINIHTLKYRGEDLRRIDTLKHLFLCSIYNLRSFPDWVMQLTQLQCLTIKNWPFLTTLPNHISDKHGLELLEIDSCPLLRKIPDCFTSLKSLKQLKIRHCPKLDDRWQNMGGEGFHLTHHADADVLQE